MMARNLIGLVCLAGALALTACGGSDAPGSGQPAADAQSSAVPTGTHTGTWSPEALEELLAPIAIYPDVVLGHVLTAATNPQEVLDAGNWLIEHQDLSGSELDAQASSLGLSPSVRALLQFPDVLDMMCMQMDWTTELGQAFTADQGAALDAVQRLRAQAKDVGNLASSPQLKVETEEQDGKEIITVAPPSPEVVYVPKYDPQAVYAPPPATIPPPSTINVTPAAGTTTTVSSDGTTTTVASAATTAESKGHSTGALVTTGLLAFGAGILVNEIFDDDDDWNKYYPNYYHGSMYYGGRPYYPPPPYMYRPPYGNGYYPAHGYTRPPNYQHGFNNNTIIVNNGGNDYWKRQARGGANGIGSRQAASPITRANPKRSDLADLNRKAADRGREVRQPATREAPSRERPTSGGYAGARPENQAAREKMVAKAPPKGVAQDLPQRPKTEYKGAKDRPTAATRPAEAKRPVAAKPAVAKPATREAPVSRPAGNADRGRERPESREVVQQRQMPATDRPAPKAAQSSHGDRTAFGSGAQSGKAERQASQRGRSSMGGSSGGGGGGGGGNKPRKPRH